MPSPNKIYTGIGSRETPREILKLMNSIASELYRQSYTLRSGGAPGADQAFEWGVWNQAPDAYHAIRQAEIYLPWKSFEEGTRSPIIARLDEPQKEAYEIAALYHPRWTYLKYGAKKLHARNVHQILGHDVTNPVLSDFVICWTQRARGSGGTGQAIRIAKAWDVKVYDLASEEDTHNLRIRLDGSFVI